MFTIFREINRFSKLRLVIKKYSNGEKNYCIEKKLFGLFWITAAKFLSLYYIELCYSEADKHVAIEDYRALLRRNNKPYIEDVEIIEKQ